MKQRDKRGRSHCPGSMAPRAAAAFVHLTKVPKNKNNNGGWNKAWLAPTLDNGKHRRFSSTRSNPTACCSACRPTRDTSCCNPNLRIYTAPGLRRGRLVRRSSSPSPSSSFIGPGQSREQHWRRRTRHREVSARGRVHAQGSRRRDTRSLSLPLSRRDETAKRPVRREWHRRGVGGRWASVTPGGGSDDDDDDNDDVRGARS
jgi:hypothetical protein